MRFFQYLGRAVLSRLRVLAAVSAVAAFSLTSIVLRHRLGRKATTSVLLRQLYFTGFEALPAISWIALILGLIIVTQSLSLLARFGAESMVGDVLVWVVVRELGPVFASVVVIARSGTAIAAELGSMKISREITALEVMGIDPMHYLVMPRVIGTALSVFLLTFYFEAVSIFGGYLLAGLGKNISFSAYASSVLEAMGFIEAGVSMLKSLLFGLIIGAFAAYHGLRVHRSMTQVPQETTKAVMGSLSLVFVVNAAITFIFFM